MKKRSTCCLAADKGILNSEIDNQTGETELRTLEVPYCSLSPLDSPKGRSFLRSPKGTQQHDGVFTPQSE
jgi:hypothetical protein